MARLAAQIARKSNSPVCLTTLTTTIIPNSSSTTFQSTPVSALKNASSPVVAPIRNITAAPPSAARTRCTHSVAINTYAPTNTVIAAAMTKPFGSVIRAGARRRAVGAR